jgi:hypothetical protein
MLIKNNNKIKVNNKDNLSHKTNKIMNKDNKDKKGKMIKEVKLEKAEARIIISGKIVVCSLCNNINY